MLADTRNLETLSALSVERHVSTTASGSTVISYAKDLGEGPVLWLVHGYPQSAYMTKSLYLYLRFVRYFSTSSASPRPILILRPKKLPGYGLSTRPKKDGIATVGAALLEASNDLFPNRPIILAGHDRGARVCHRLAVLNAHPPQDESAKLHSYKLLGTVCLDIVPTLVQWQAFAKPVASTTYFHWPLLASPLGPHMVEAFGGAKWTHMGLDRICGDNIEGRKAMQSDQAWEVYESLHSKRETIEGSCADYASGCFDEPPLQEADQREGRKVEVPILVMWSQAKLAKMHNDVGAIWKDWVKDASLLTARSVGDGVGHYLPEEASTVIGKAVKDFVAQVTK
ncbi:alpha/beta hydrolase [Aureobasidium subglaciale]|nr:alpha/beta hydrolase [Aureobasidium subglaciale]KAI5224167.1 alpha/beta hydrolase [Aureobasidium subglaciale]KAI5228360.1 alpha/beta hydrolase [Aureobasidium subglaciale]KAI5262925.1 alpha/beta hydrolase [Aureobasidium subglaciale]